MKPTLLSKAPEVSPLASSLYSLPPRTPLLVTETLIGQYRKDSKPQLNAGRDAEILEAQEDFLTKIKSLSPKNPESPTFQEVSRGLGLQQTPFDKVSGSVISLFEPSNASSILMARLYEFKHLELMTHPSIIESRMAMLNRDNTINGRIPRDIPVMEEIIEKNIAISWKNLGWAINERNYEHLDGEITTTSLRAQGMWSFLSYSKSNPLVASVVLGPSHPDLVSALSLAELSLAGCVVFVPCDGTQASVEAQKIMLETACDLIDSHPILALHQYHNYRLSNGESLSKHIAREAKRRIGVTLKPYPVQRSVDIAREFREEYGVEIFRCFDPRDTYELPKVIAGIRRHSPSAHLFASQVTGVNSAERCADSGANVLIMNIGDGGHCKTASGSGMSTSNPSNFYRVQKALNPEVGIILDGGVGPMALPLSMGASGCMKHGSLIQGTIQQIPCLQAISSNGSFYKLYSGEAAKRTKFIAGQVDVAGLPKNVEGEDGAIRISLKSGDLEEFSAIIALDRMLEPVAKTTAFQQGRSLQDLLGWSNPIVMLPTPEAVAMAAPHAQEYP